MSKRQLELNRKAVALLEDLEQSGRMPTVEDLDALQAYAGRGGLDGQSGRGILYEFYTPLPIVSKMWGMARDHGFKGGSVLEPSVGTGRFLRFVNWLDTNVDAFEFTDEGDDISLRICRACFPMANVTDGAFESIFYKGMKRVGTAKRYDLVIGNPPYGARSGFWQAPKLEGKHTNTTRYEHYFIEKGLELLKPGGILIFIVPSTFMDAPAYANFREQVQRVAFLKEAWRLPLRAFDFTAIQTDIIALKKY